MQARRCGDAICFALASCYQKSKRITSGKHQSEAVLAVVRACQGAQSPVSKASPAQSPVSKASPPLALEDQLCLPVEEQPAAAAPSCFDSPRKVYKLYHGGSPPRALTCTWSWPSSPAKVMCCGRCTCMHICTQLLAFAGLLAHALAQHCHCGHCVIIAGEGDCRAATMCSCRSDDAPS